MRKSIFVFLIIFFVTSIAFAELTNYYVSRTNDIYRSGTTTPIIKYSKMNFLCNTFSITYKMDKYYIINDSEKPYSRHSLIGCEDINSTTIFDPLIVINEDKIVEKISNNEIRKANIRFVKLVSGKLDLNNKDNDFRLDKILYIDLNNLRFNTHNYAEIDMYVKPKNERLYDRRGQYMDRIPIIIETIPRAKADNLF